MTLHEDIAPSVTVAVLILGSTAMVSMVLRMYTRISRGTWGTEDWLMLFGSMPLVALTVVAIFGSYYGIGATDDTITRYGATYMEKAAFFFFIGEILYCVTIILVKLSIAVMLNRIASKKFFIYINYAIMALCGSVNLGTLAYIVFRCQPIEAAWAPSVLGEEEQCNPLSYLRNVFFFCTAVNIFTDWATALMPIALLWNIQMNRNSKISVAAILGLGFFTSISGLIRLKYTVYLTRSHDYFYSLAYITIWGYAEPALGMIAGNIATLRPMLRCILQSDPSVSHQSSMGTFEKLRSRNNPQVHTELDYGYELGMANGTTTPEILGGQNARPSSSRIASSRIASSLIASFAGSDRESHTEPLDEGRIYVSKEVEVVST